MDKKDDENRSSYVNWAKSIHIDWKDLLVLAFIKAEHLMHTDSIVNDAIYDAQRKAFYVMNGVDRE